MAAIPSTAPSMMASPRQTTPSRSRANAAYRSRNVGMALPYLLGQPARRLCSSCSAGEAPEGVAVGLDLGTHGDGDLEVADGGRPVPGLRPAQAEAEVRVVVGGIDLDGGGELLLRPAGL